MGGAGLVGGGLSPGPGSSPPDLALLRPGCRLNAVTEELATAAETVLSRQAMVTQLQQELWDEEQSSHPRER